MKRALFIYFTILFVVGCGQDALHEAASGTILKSIEQEILNGADLNSQKWKGWRNSLTKGSVKKKKGLKEFGADQRWGNL